MEYWWTEQNGASSPLSNVASSINIGISNTVDYSIWMPTTQSQPNNHGSTMYDTVTTFPSGLYTATSDTFIESISTLTESISTNTLYNQALFNNYPSMDNSAIYMENYQEAITQYYNTRSFINLNRHLNPTAPFLNQDFRNLTTPQTEIINHSQLRTTTTNNFYPNWKNYEKQSVNLSNFETKNEDNKLSQTEKWYGTSSSESFITATKHLPDGKKQKKASAHEVQEYIEPKYDYNNPFHCEFCEISDREPTQRSWELYDQCCLLRKIPTNPNELTDGIKQILTNKELNTPSDKDKSIPLQLDAHKRRMKKLLPLIDFSGNKHNCVTDGCNCHQYALSLVAPDEPRPAASFVPTPGRRNFNDILKMSGDQTLYGKDQQYESTPSTSSSAEENTRRRMVEQVNLGLLNNKLYMQLLNGTQSRSRLDYTKYFGNVSENAAGGDAENLFKRK